MKSIPSLTFLLLLLWAPAFPGCGKLGAGARSGTEVKCRGQLKQLFMALVQYKSKHGDYPAKDGEAFVAELFVSGVLKEKGLYLCPAKGRDNADADPKTNPADFTDYMGPRNGKKSPVRLKALLLQKKVPPQKVPLVWDKKGNHEGGRNVVFADGSVVFLSEADFEAMVKEVYKN